MSAPSTNANGNANAARSRRRAALWVLPLETGGCGASAQSIAALRSPGFAPALSAEGIAFASSPRHADVLLVAGPLSAASREAVRRIVEAAPLPRAIVAVGDCAIDGCVFAGSPRITESLAEELDVNVEIAGCPPSPDAILAAINEAARLLAGSDTAPAADAEAAAAGSEARDTDEADTIDEVDDDGADDDDDDEAAETDEMPRDEEGDDA